MPLTNETVVVFGATGRQGGSVATELAKQFPDAQLRLVSRQDPGSDKAKALLATMPDGGKNCTVVQADMDVADDKLNAACAGAYGCFLVGAFWPAAVDGGAGANTPLDATVEMAAYRNVIAACKAGGVKHLVFSALEDTRKVKDFNADGAYPALDEKNGFVVPHFDGKGTVLGELNAQQEMKVDFVFVGFYYENFFGMKPNKGEDGKYALYLPLGGNPHYMVTVADVGKTVAPLFKRDPEFGSSVVLGTEEKSWPISGCIGEKMSGDEIAKAFSEVCLGGEPVAFVDVPVAGFIQTGISMGMPEIVAKDFGQMFAYYQCKTYLDNREEALKQAEANKLVKFRAWLEGMKGALYPDAAPAAATDAAPAAATSAEPAAPAAQAEKKAGGGCCVIA